MLKNRETGEETHVGIILVVEKNKSYQYMSDDWTSSDHIVYWDFEAGRPKREVINVGYPGAQKKDFWDITVDATREVVNLYTEYLINYFSKEYEQAEKRRFEEPNKGDVVTVVAGKYSKGVTGKIVAQIYADYRTGYHTKQERKFAIALDDEMFEKKVGTRTFMNYKNVAWVWARNVKKVEQFVLNQVEMLENAKERTKWKLKEEKLL